jgi:hypothetical protein
MRKVCRRAVYAFTALLALSPTRAFAQDLWSQWFTCGAPPPLDEPQSAKTSGTSDTILDRLGQCNIGLHSKINEDSEGATVGYTEAGAGSKKNGFQSQFALVWRPPPAPISPTTSLFPLWSIDGNIATQSARKDTFLNIRPEFGIRHIEYGDAPIQNPVGLGSLAGEFIRFGPFYEVNQDFSVQNLMAEVSATYTRLTGPVPIGRYVPLGQDGIYWRFRPYGTVQVGRNVEGLTLSNEFDRTRLRVILDPVFELAASKDFLESVGLTKAVLRAEDIFTILPLEGRNIKVGRKLLHSDNTHNQLSLSLNFGLNKNLSFGPSYTTGDIAPNFVRSHVFMVSLKLGFGPGGSGERLF